MSRTGPPPRVDAASRAQVERRIRPVLLWLSRRPKLLLPVAAALLLIGGLAAPPAVGVPLLLVLLALIGALSYLSWPVLVGAQRVLRLATLGLLLLAVVGRITG